MTGVGSASPLQNAAAKLDIWIGWTVEIVAALLLLAETVILFSGVFARYVLHSALVWSDELASILFLWLAMLGAVVAFRRGEHMRMTALADRCPPWWKAFFEALAPVAALLFLVLILTPAFHYADEERAITTPALEISNVFRAAALPIGFGLMALGAVLRMVQMGVSRQLLLAAGIVVALTAALWFLQPALRGLGNINLLIFFVGVSGVAVFAAIPIAFAFALATFGYLALTTHTPMLVLVGRMDEGMSHLILLSVPLFVFLGLLIEMTGMARVMVAFLASLIGHVKGGLSYVLVGAMYLVSGISGSKAADMAAVTPVLFPEMQKRGAKPGDLVALLAATGAQTETVPPSLVLITIGSVTGVSIAGLFTGGLLPALVAGLMLCALISYRYRNEDVSHLKRASLRQIGRAFLVGLPALALPFVIRAAVIEGVSTATEVSTLGVVYSVIIGLVVYRQFDWRRVLPMLVETVALSGAILLIIGAATGMAWALTQSGFSRQLAQFMGSLPGGAGTFLAVSIVAFIVLGSVLEGIPAIVLFGPLLFPIARQMGVHEIHYAMVVVLAMGVGLFAPPFGVGYYAACAIGRVKPADGMGPIVGYLLALIVGLVLVAAIPWLSTGFL
jgi:tripartite ATP-independent transporter DctM subunit